jgi:hypothetical protein
VGVGDLAVTGSAVFFPVKGSRADFGHVDRAAPVPCAHLLTPVSIRQTLAYKESKDSVPLPIPGPGWRRGLRSRCHPGPLGSPRAPVPERQGPRGQLFESRPRLLSTR